MKADLFQEKLEEGEWILLCSDGLINEVTDQEIHQEVLAGGTPQEICQRLVTRTLESGAPGQRHRCAVPVVRRSVLP